MLGSTSATGVECGTPATLTTPLGPSLLRSTLFHMLYYLLLAVALGVVQVRMKGCIQGVCTRYTLCT